MDINDDNISDEENNSSDDDQEYSLYKDNYDDKENICDNYIYTFIVFFIQSLISCGYFFLFYIFQFAVRNLETCRKVLAINFSIIVIFDYFIFYFSKEGFYSKNKKSSNYFIFFLINIQKIMVDVGFYINLSVDPKEIIEENKEYGVEVEPVDQLEFPQFQARLIWKISMCLLYFLLIIYYYFKIDKNTINIFILLLFSSVSLTAFFLLIFFTQESNYSSMRIVGSSMYIIFEILWMIASLFIEKIYRFSFKSINIYINWKVNRIDYLRSFIILFSLFELFLIFLKKNIRCCGIIMNNYNK